jgi:hypothetical protein
MSSANQMVPSSGITAAVVYNKITWMGRGNVT